MRNPLPATISAACAVFALVSATSHAAISVIGTGSAVTNANSSPGEFTLSAQGPGSRDGIYSFSFAAGANSDMLVVTVSTEASGEAWSVSYDGTPMTVAAQSSVGSGASIFYLANPSATGDISIDFTGKGTVNGIAMGIASLDATNPGDEIVFDNGATGTGVSSIDITPTNPDSFLMFAGDANSTAGASPTLGAPLTSVRGTWPNDVGSNTGAAGYENGVAASLQTYSWTPDASPRGIAAAAFSAIPEPSAALLGSVGLLALLRRRRS